MKEHAYLKLTLESISTGQLDANVFGEESSDAFALHGVHLATISSLPRFWCSGVSSRLQEFWCFGAFRCLACVFVGGKAGEREPNTDL